MTSNFASAYPRSIFQFLYKFLLIHSKTIRIANSRINDTVFRLLLIPCLGIGLPLITGLIRTSTLSDWKTQISFLYTIGIAFVIWHTNRWIIFFIRPYFSRLKVPFKRIAILLSIVLLFTVPASITLIVGWFWIFNHGVVEWKILGANVVLIGVSVIFITPLYEILFLAREAQLEKLEQQKLKDQKVEAELEAIKNQIDPHFIFNALNNLSYLIETDSERARQFNITLARVYLYILQNKDIHLVTLGQELQFLKDYFYLSRIRFESTIYLSIDIPHVLEETYIPSISLQLLLENAIKHNQFSEADPLCIKVFAKGDYLVVHNRVRKFRFTGSGLKIGLANLDTRCRLLTGYPLIIEETGDAFSVFMKPVAYATRKSALSKPV